MRCSIGIVFSPRRFAPTHLRSPLLAAQHIIAVPTQWFKFRANNAHQNEAFKHFGFPIH